MFVRVIKFLFRHPSKLCSSSEDAVVLGDTDSSGYTSSITNSDKHVTPLLGVSTFRKKKRSIGRHTRTKSSEQAILPISSLRSTDNENFCSHPIQQQGFDSFFFDEYDDDGDDDSMAKFLASPTDLPRVLQSDSRAHARDNDGDGSGNDNGNGNGETCQHLNPIKQIHTDSETTNEKDAIVVSNIHVPPLVSALEEKKRNEAPKLPNIINIPERIIISNYPPPVLTRKDAFSSRLNLAPAVSDAATGSGACTSSSKTVRPSSLRRGDKSQAPPPVVEIAQRICSDVSSLGFPEHFPSGHDTVSDQHPNEESSHFSAISPTDKWHQYMVGTQLNTDKGQPPFSESPRGHKEDAGPSLFYSLPALFDYSCHLEYGLKEGVEGMSTAMIEASENLLRDLERAVHDNVNFSSVNGQDSEPGIVVEKTAPQNPNHSTLFQCQPIDKKKCLILLMDPQTKIFEFVQVPYQPELTTVGDILQQVRQEANDIRLAKLSYTGLTYQGMHITAPMVPLEMILQAEIASKRFPKPILLAVAKNYTSVQIEACAQQLMTSPKVLRLLEMEHPLLLSNDKKNLSKQTAPPIQNKTSKGVSSYQHAAWHQKGHCHRHHHHPTTVSIGQRVISWVQAHYGDRI